MTSFLFRGTPIMDSSNDAHARQSTDDGFGCAYMMFARGMVIAPVLVQK